jgi:uncharacterized protein YegP (UPF0339 family)
MNIEELIMGYYELKRSEKGTLLTQPYYFVLKASNGKVIATSEMYSTKQSAKEGIRSVQENGLTDEIKDLTPQGLKWISDL